MASEEHGKSDFDEQLAAYVVGLTELRDQEQAELDALKARIGAKQRNVTRINHAIRDLDGTPPAAPQKAARSDKGTPRTATLNKVREAIAARGEEGVTYAGIIESTRLSHDTVGRAVRHLREEQIIRNSGVNRDKAIVFKMMPEHMAQKENGALALAS